MRRESPGRYIVVLFASDLLAFVVSLLMAQVLRQRVSFGQPFVAAGGGFNLAIGLMAAIFWTVTFRQLQAYDLDHILRPSQELESVLGGIAVSMLLLAGVLYFTYRGLSRLLFVYFFVLDLLLTVCFRAAVRWVFKRRSAPGESLQRILIVGAGKVGIEMADLLTERRWMGLETVGFLDDDANKVGQKVSRYPVLACLDQVAEIVQEQHIDEVIVTLPGYAHRRLEKLVGLLYDTRANIRVVPDLFPLAYLRTSVGVLGDMPLITLKEPVFSASALLMKRILDVVISLMALLLLWPLMLVAALCIKLDSPGPVFFRQARLGLHGRLFTIYKLRTMFTGAEGHIDLVLEHTQDGKAFLRKDGHDPRVTRVGQILRRWSLDELPQVFNVIKGEMSIVGPRPDLPALAQGYEAWQRKRYSVPPGITGWWQVTGRSTKPSTLNVEDDLYYIRNYSLLLDVKIILRTVGAVLRRRGAY